MNLLLVDSSESLDHYRRHDLLKTGMVIATHARGALACDLSGVKYRCLEEWTHASQWSEEARSLYLLLNAALSELERTLPWAVTFFEETGVAPLTSDFYSWALRLTTLRSKAEFVLNLLEPHPHAKILLRRERGRPAPLDSSGAFPQDVNLISLLLEGPLAASQCGLKQRLVFHEVSSDSNDIQDASNKIILRRAVRTLLGKVLSLWRSEDSRQKIIVLWRGGDDWTALCPSLTKRGFRWLNLPAPSYRPVTPTGLLEIPNQLKAVFSHKGADLSPLLKEVWTTFVDQELSYALEYKSRVERWLDGLEVTPRALVTESSIDRLPLQCAFAVFRRRGIPFFCLQEGAGYGSLDIPIYDWVEVTSPGVFCAYGEGNAEHYLSNQNVKKKIIPTGSPRVDGILERFESPALRWESIQRSVYVPTVVGENWFHQPNVGYSATHYFELQKRIIYLMADVAKRMRIAVKPHPSDTHLLKWLKGPTRPSGVEVLTGAFIEHLRDDDLYVFDFPSTSFLYASVTHAAMAVYRQAGVVGLTPRNERFFRARSELCENLGDLTQVIQRWDRGRGPVKLREDRSFARHYAVHQGDGQSAERIATIIDQFKSS